MCETKARSIDRGATVTLFEVLNKKLFPEVEEVLNGCFCFCFCFSRTICQPLISSLALRPRWDSYDICHETQTYISYIAFQQAGCCYAYNSMHVYMEGQKAAHGCKKGQIAQRLPFRRAEVLLVERLQHPVHLHQLGGRLRRYGCGRILKRKKYKWERTRRKETSVFDENEARRRETKPKGRS